MDVVEPAADDLARAGRDALADFSACRLDVHREDGEVLERAVVEVEAEPHELALARLGERPLALRAPLEEHLALERRADAARSFLKERASANALVRL